MRLKHPRRVWALVGALLLGTVGADWAYGVAVPPAPGEARRVEHFRSLVRGGAGVYRGRPHTGYGLNPRLERVNSDGFSDREWSRDRTREVPRILCLGASTTEGGNAAGRQGAYPYLLGLGLSEALGGEFDVLNAGTSGWSSAETLVAWFLRLQDLRPEVVVIHHAVSDVMPRNTNGFEADYSHWRVALQAPDYSAWERFLIRWSDFYARRLVRDGAGALRALTTRTAGGETPFTRHGETLPLSTAAPFRRNIRSIGASAEALGATVCLMTVPVRPALSDDDFPDFRVGVAQHNEILRELAAERGWLLVDLERTFPGLLGAEHAAVFRDLVHVTKAGNQAKARALAEELARSWHPKWSGAPADREAPR